MKNVWFLFLLSQLAAANVWAASNPPPAYCEFASRTSELQPFVETLTSACVALDKLCKVAPAHFNCLAVTGQTEQQPETVMQTALSSQYINELKKINDNLFKTQPKLYIAKGKVLDEESRIPNKLRTALIAQIVTVSTAEWVGYFGDPYREDTLYINTPQMQMAGLAFLGTAALATATRSPRLASVASKTLGYVAEKIPYLASRFRSSVSLIPRGVKTATTGAMETWNASSPSGWAWRAGQSAIVSGAALIPSPAHMVRFDFMQDDTIITKDMEAARAEIDAKLFNDVFSSTTAMGVSFIVGDIGLRNSATAGKLVGDKIAEQVAKRLSKMKTLNVSLEGRASAASATRIAMTAGKASKVLRFTRVTPASFLAGLFAGEVIDESIKAYRLNKLENELTKASELDAVSVMNELFQVFASESYYVRTLMNFERELESFGSLDYNIPDGPRLNLARGNFSTYMKALNRPELTGAKFLQRLICQTYDLLPTPSDVPSLTAKEKDHIKIKERMLMRGLSWQYLENLKSEIKKYDKGLKEYQSYLTKMALAHPEIAANIKERTVAVGRWRSEIAQFTANIHLPSAIVEWLGEAPNRMAQEKIMTAMHQIISIEWSKQNDKFHNVYRCDEI